jgi:hypothetical protein
MARHDIICPTCELIIRDITLSMSDILGEGKTTKQCPDCKSSKMNIWWGSGEAPKGWVVAVTNEEKFAKAKTLGDYWDSKGVDFASKEYKKASVKRVEKMRNKAVKNAKNKNNKGT